MLSRSGALTEIHEDRTREVRYVRVVDGKEVERRPMRADEIKSGEWLDPKGLHGFHRSNSPEQYRQQCRELRAKGFKALTPTPRETFVTFDYPDADAQ